MKNTPKRMPPVQIADDLYWIGVYANSPAHLITTSEGIVLIDTASDFCVDELVENIESLGFDVRDVRHIIHSHGHFDHTGATTRIVALSGAKTYIGRADADAVAGRDLRTWASRTPPENAADYYFEPDVLIDDGDALTVGETTFRFVSTPGHTDGVISIFWNAHYNGKEYLAGMFGGAGTKALTDEYILRDGRSFSMREEYIKSIDRIINEPVELHVGNHPGNNNHTSKAERITGGNNPFITEKTWEPFLLRMRREVIDEYDLFGDATSHALDAILDTGVITILRGVLGEELINTARAIFAGGVKCLEVTFDAKGDTPDDVIAENIAALVHEFPESYIGAGTVLTEAQVVKAARAGAKFIISPDTNPDIIKKTKVLGLISIPGALTPTEASLASRSGADFVKLFPIGTLGKDYLKAIKAPLSNVRFLAVGGVDVNNAREYMNAGAVGIGIGSGIASSALIKSGDFAKITEQARKYIEEVKK